MKNWDTPGFSPYSTQWKPDFTGFVPGTNPVCPRDNPGDEGRHRKFKWKKFMCLFRSLFSGQKAFFGGGGWGCIFWGPPRQKFYTPPSFIQPPTPRRVFPGWGGGAGVYTIWPRSPYQSLHSLKAPSVRSTFLHWSLLGHIPFLKTHPQWFRAPLGPHRGPSWQNILAQNLCRPFLRRSGPICTLLWEKESIYFIGFLYPPPAWKFLLWCQKSSSKNYLSVVVVYFFLSATVMKEEDIHCF